MALLMRAELAVPGEQILSNEQYNQLLTMHGTVMLLLYATPILFGFANYILPLQIGSPDVAFPRLNALSYWLFLFGGLIVMSGFVTAAPLSGPIHSPGPGADLWFSGLIVAGLGTILGAVNTLTTIICLRAPGVTMFRMPIRAARVAAHGLPFHDTYFVVGHFHYVLFGTIVFPVFAGIYFWLPKMTGRMMDETLGRIHFWTMFIGFHLTFLCTTGWGTRACRGATPTTCPPTGSRC